MSTVKHYLLLALLSLGIACVFLLLMGEDDSDAADDSNSTVTIIDQAAPETNSEYYGSVLIGTFGSARYEPTEVKLVNLGYRTDLYKAFTQQVELGGWIDTAGHGRLSSGYGAYMVGVQTDGAVFGRLMVGTAVITTPDAYLGGIWPEFTESLYLGTRGCNGNSIGVMYQHISSAGIFKQNYGRDFLGVSISVP